MFKMNTTSKTKLAIIIPCYNEELVIKTTVNTLSNLLDQLINKEKISSESYIYIVDDGSKDSSWNIIKEMHSNNPERVKGCHFVRNYGNQKALIAGLLDSRKLGCDCAISIDADLQQDENSIEIFIDEFHNGAEIVSGIRNNRKTDSFFKKVSASAFYKIMNLLGDKIPPHHSDYRLVSKKALDVLSEFSESELFLRGFFHETGLKTSYVKFDVKPRKLGTSKFSFISLTSLALNGITSYSIVPLRLITALGFLTIILSFGLGIETLYDKFILKDTPSGWATIVILLLFFGGLQIFCLGIIGEYLGQVFTEVKSRPRYIKDDTLT